VEWNEDKTFKQRHLDPQIGRSLLFGDWMTTPVVEILEQGENGYMHFKTENSEYILIKD